MQDLYLKTFKGTFLLSYILTYYPHPFYSSVKQKEEGRETKGTEGEK